MRFLIQRVLSATITIPDQKITRSIWPWLVIFVGINKNDEKIYPKAIEKFCNKINQIKFFSDESGKINSSNSDINGEILLVSNFTLYGRHDKGSKIDFSQSASFDRAKSVYEELVFQMKESEIKFITGEFGEYMEINQNLSGPVNTIRDFE